MKASPVLAVCLMFDAARLFFGIFWFFGPALAAAYCTSEVGGTLAKWTFGVLGTKTAAAVCTTGAAAAGSLLSAPLILFGTVMSMAVGLMGWLVIGLVIIMTNSRIFKDHAGHSFLFIFGLGLSEIPLIGALPALTGSTLRMYHTQIKNDKESVKRYATEHAAAQLQERRQQATEMVQLQQTRLNQIQRQNAEREEMYDEEQSENEASAEVSAEVLHFPSKRTQKEVSKKSNIPDEVREAA